MPGEEGILGPRKVPARRDRQGRARNDVVLPLSTAPGNNAVTAALGHYADRGVFRGFRHSAEARGRVAYQFNWLTRRPMHASIDRRGVLTFPVLLPQAPRDIVAEMKAIVAARSTRAVPDHKRIDARRARLACAVRKGDLSLSVEIRGRNQEYAVTQALNLVNDMFVALHESHPGYLIEHFGISQE